MRRTVCHGVLLACAFCLPAGAAMSNRIVSYRIRAQLDTGPHTVTGQETLTWRNDSPDTVGELRFHLYLNAFQNEKSTFMRESGGQLRGDQASKDSWGWIDVHRMQIAGGADLTRAIRFIHPDDDNADDRTVIAVTLPQPVAPGGSITLDIDFLSRLPKVFARTGYHDDFYMVGQWFPKIGVYEKAGDRYARVGGWNCHQFHANSEFYADYGVYDVTLTVPANYVVGATGVRQSESEDAAHRTKTYRYYQEDVHDFSWTASPRFVRLERRFDPASMVKPADMAAAEKLLGLPPSELALRPVRMILLMQPEHLWQADRHFRALENGLKWFGLWYGAYPYQTITVVDPPYGAEGAGGMEYPTLITAGTNWWPGAHEGNPEEVVIHEFGHQYWYGMVGSNEFEESWLDEGFNTYSTGKVLDVAYGMRDLPVHAFGIPVAHLLGLPQVDSDMTNRSAYLFYGKHDPVVRNAWQYYDSTQYAIDSYMRPATLLRTLENYLGPPVMARVMRAWFERYRFHHPTSVDFEKLTGEVSGRDMTWFFDQFVFGTNWLNYRVDSVACNRIDVKLGSYVENGKRTTVTEKDAERIEGERRKKGTPDEYRIVVKLVRDGESVFPVDMRMTLENGQIVREHWDGRDRWVKYEYRKTAKVRSVEIDPGRKILLDGSFADNSYTVETARLPLAKWASNLLFWIQMVLP
jgi:Peptidase family M1 domain